MELISDIERAWWNERTPFRYQRMIRKHRRLWRWVKQYIQKHGVRSVLEPGCGLMPPARRWVKQYQGVDLNERADALHDDFLRMDVTPWVGVDLLLASAIMEHMGPEYNLFLRQVARATCRRKRLYSGPICSMIALARSRSTPTQGVTSMRRKSSCRASARSLRSTP